VTAGSLASGARAPFWQPLQPEEARVTSKNWGLPRSTGRIEADRSAALLAQRTATTDAQRAAVALRLTDIRSREAALTPAE
jgi:hypothetical protein